MDKKEINNAIAILKEVSPKRNFKQSVDLIINLKGVNIKKAESNIDHILRFPHVYKEEVKVCALVGHALAKKGESCKRVIVDSDFDKLSKKEIKKLAREYDFFVAQADIMPKIASTFGKYLGPLKKMPNPKLGAVVPPTGELAPLIKNLQKTVHLMTKGEASVKVQLGNEETNDEELNDNALAAYNAVTHDLPQGKQNVKATYLKFTMGPSVKIGESKEDFVARQESKKSAKETPKPEPVKNGPKKEESPKEEAEVKEDE